MALVPTPSWKGGTLYYKGSAYVVNSTTYWNNWQSAKYTITGTSRATLVNTPGESYTMTLTCRNSSDYFLLPSGTRVKSIDLSWNINTRMIDVPTWIGGTLRYTGSEYNVASDQYWSWWNPNYVEISGNTAETEVPYDMDYEIHLYPIVHEVGDIIVMDTDFGSGHYEERTVSWTIEPMLIPLPAWTGSSNYIYNGTT